MRTLLTLLVILVATLASGTSLAQQPASGPSPERLARLSKGINTSHWFAQAEVSPERWRTYITADDIRLIREMGFNHIRLSLNPEALFIEDDPGRLIAEHAEILDDAIEMILAENLAVIIDLHPESAFKHRLRDEPAFVNKVEAFWGALAERMSRHDPERVFLEVMNEPEFQDAQQWMRVQQRLLTAMRRGAPEHTLIATGPEWSNYENLLKITPVDDPNVVYNFHLYDPHTFTHQGATWGAPFWRHYGDLMYPSSPETAALVLAGIDPSAEAAVRNYGKERWNRDRLESLVKQAADWAERHGVHLTVNEFGVYRRHTPPEARLAWLTDVRTLFEQYGIGWAMWDYAGGFSVINTEDGRRVPDEGTLKALGLQN